jgi:hypothetical protein
MGITDYVRCEQCARPEATYIKSSASCCGTNSLGGGCLSQGGHLNPLTIEAFSRIMSSLFDRFRTDTGSANRRMREYVAVDDEAGAISSCITLP